MKKPLIAIVVIAFFSNSIYAQSDADKLRVDKPKVLSKLDNLALAQLTVNYKLTTTAKAIGKGNMGAIAGSRVTAYLETTDGDLTENDFQEITNYFYSYFQKTLKSNGIDTIAWNKIAATDFYKNADEKVDEGKEEKGGNAWVTSTAHKGNVMYGGGTPFAFGKIKKASSFCEEIGAPAGFFYLTVDFADVIINIDIKQTAQHDVGGGWYYPATTKAKTTWAINPEMRVGQPDNGWTLFWNKKSQSEVIWIKQDIAGGLKYNDSYSEDISKARSGLAKQFAFRKEMTPILIQTTKEKYKASAKKALEKYAEAFVAKVKAVRKS